MSTAQKIIKYLALAFAIFLVVSIVSGIVVGITALSGALGLKKDNDNTQLNNLEVIANIENNNISSLNIDIDFSNLKIVKGNIFNVESSSTTISSEQKNNSLIIKEDSNWFFNNKANEIIITIPDTILFDDVKISTGAGEVYIEKLNAKNLKFEMGAGKVQIQDLYVSNKAKINGGAGKLEVLSGEINNLNLDMGVGKCEINSKLTGNNDIDAGIGKLNINLLDKIDNYEIKVNKGIGAIKINGREVSNGTLYGNGTAEIKIDGGIGSIDINEI